MAVTATYTGKLTPPKEKNDAIPESLNSIILKLLKKTPDDRYLNTTYLINDLNRYS